MDSGHRHTIFRRERLHRLIPLERLAEHREAAAVAAGEDVEVDIALDTDSRELALPPDLADALAANAQARTFFDGLSFTHRKEWVRWVEEAKKAETRAARIIRTVESLHAGKRAR